MPSSPAFLHGGSPPRKKSAQNGSLRSDVDQGPQQQIMSIDFKIDEENPAFVRLSCSGTYTRDAMLALFDQAFDIAIRMRRGAILIDIRDVSGAPPGVFERYQLGVGSARIQRGKKPLVTAAVVGYEPMIDPRRLGEIVFRNRGGVGKVFTSLKDAIAWLEKSRE